MRVHRGLNKTLIAVRYYHRVAPGKYEIEQKAKMQFQQERNFDYDILMEIVKEICNEQISMLENEKKFNEEEDKRERQFYLEGIEQYSGAILKKASGNKKSKG